MSHEWIDIKGDRVAMKKGKLGWRLVYPTRNEDGSRNWPNTLFGGWNNLVFIIVATLILTGISYAYKHDVATIQSNYEKIASDPIGWCKDVNTGRTDPFEYFKRQNFSNFTIGE